MILFRISIFTPPFLRGVMICFFTLIQKVRDLKNVNDFRHISLIGCQYNIIAKPLANRSMEVIGTVVSIDHSALIKGMQILDMLFLLNDNVAWSKVSKKPLLIMKVDFEKAYDSLSWDYLM